MSNPQAIHDGDLPSTGANATEPANIIRQAVVVQTVVSVQLGILTGTNVELLPQPITIAVPDPALLAQVPQAIEEQRQALADKLSEVPD